MTSRMKDEDGDDDVIDVKKDEEWDQQRKRFKARLKKNLTQKKEKRRRSNKTTFWGLPDFYFIHVRRLLTKIYIKEDSLSG